MKIAISSETGKLSGPVDTRFGRARGFIIHDTVTGENNFIDNTQNLNSAQGAGIQSAKTVINAGAEVLITGNVGPKAFSALNTAKIKVFTGAEGSALEALESYRTGLLIKADEANVESHW